MMISASNNK